MPADCISSDLAALTRLERRCASGEIPLTEFRALAMRPGACGAPLGLLYGPHFLTGEPSCPESLPWRMDFQALMLADRDVGVIKHKSFDSTPTHVHNFHEMIFVLEGQAHNGVDGRSFSLGPGDFFLLRAGVPHSISCSADAVILNYLIRSNGFAARFPGFCSSGGISARFFLDPAAQGDYLLFHTAPQSSVQRTALLLGEEYLTGESTSREVLARYLELLLTQLSSGCAHEMQTDLPLPAYYGEYRKIISYLAVNYPTATLEELSRTLSFSPRHVARILAACGEENFSALLLRRRMDAACRLLSDTALPVEEIGRAVGFSDPAYFSRAFRKEFGVPPSKWRGMAC